MGQLPDDVEPFYIIEGDEEISDDNVINFDSSVYEKLENEEIQMDRNESSVVDKDGGGTEMERSESSVVDKEAGETIKMGRSTCSVVDKEDGKIGMEKERKDVDIRVIADEDQVRVDFEKDCLINI